MQIETQRHQVDWGAVLLASVVSLVVIPILRLVPGYGFYASLIASPLVGSIVAGATTRNFGDEFIDSVVAAWASLLALLVGWVATMVWLGFGTDFILAAGATYLFAMLVIGFPIGGVVGAFAGHFTARLTPYSLAESLPGGFRG